VDLGDGGFGAVPKRLHNFKLQIAEAMDPWIAHNSYHGNTNPVTVQGKNADFFVMPNTRRRPDRAGLKTPPLCSGEGLLFLKGR
jgi:hypothetical protein